MSIKRNISLMIGLLIGLSVFSQSGTVTAARNYVNGYIVPNGVQSITGQKMNTALNKIIDALNGIDSLYGRVDSAYVIGDTMYFVRGAGPSFLVVLPAGGSSGRKVDTIYRTAGADSIIYSINGTRYAVKDSFENGVLLLDTAEVDYFTVINAQNTPPGSPVTGATYTVGTSPTGAWAGQSNKIAQWNGSSWDFTTPTQGDYYYNQSNGYTFQFRSGAWVRTSSIPVLVNGQSLSTGVRLGTNNLRALTFETNNVARGRFDSLGRYYVYNVPTGSTGDTFVLKWNSVTNQFTKIGQSSIGGSSYTASNGITLSGSDVQLGGTINNTTSLSFYNGLGDFGMYDYGGIVGIGSTVRDNNNYVGQFDVQVDSVNNQIATTVATTGINGSIGLQFVKDTDDTARFVITGLETRNTGDKVLSKSPSGDVVYWRDVSSIGGADSATFATKAFVTGRQGISTISKNAAKDSIILIDGFGNRSAAKDSTGGGSTDSTTFATKAYVDAKDAQWSVSRTTDSSNFIFTNGATATQIKDNGWTLLATSVASNASSVDFTGLTSTYSTYMIIFDELYTSSGGSSLWLRVGTGGTPTWISTGSPYITERFVIFGASSAISSNGGDNQIVITGGLNATQNEGAAGIIWAYNPSKTSSYKRFHYHHDMKFNDNSISSGFGMGQYESTTAVTALRIMCSTGNIYGTFKLYGMK